MHAAIEKPTACPGNVDTARAPITNSTDCTHCMRNGVRWSCRAQNTRWITNSMLNSTRPGMYARRTAPIERAPSKVFEKIRPNGTETTIRATEANTVKRPTIRG